MKLKIISGDNKTVEKEFNSFVANTKIKTIKTESNSTFRSRNNGEEIGFETNHSLFIYYEERSSGETSRYSSEMNS